MASSASVGLWLGMALHCRVHGVEGAARSGWSEFLWFVTIKGRGQELYQELLNALCIALVPDIVLLGSLGPLEEV